MPSRETSALDPHMVTEPTPLRDNSNISPGNCSDVTSASPSQGLVRGLPLAPADNRGGCARTEVPPRMHGG